MWFGELLRGGYHERYRLGQAFQGLPGQLGCAVTQFTVYSAKRYESVNFSQLLLQLLSFFFLNSKGEFGLAAARGTLLFLCVCENTFTSS